MTRGDRRRNARRERLRTVLPRGGAVIGIDLAEEKQALAVIDHDVRVLARKTVRVKAFRLGEALDWSAGQARAKGFARSGPAPPASSTAVSLCAVRLMPRSRSPARGHPRRRRQLLLGQLRLGPQLPQQPGKGKRRLLGPIPVPPTQPVRQGYRHRADTVPAPIVRRPGHSRHVPPPHASLHLRFPGTARRPDRNRRPKALGTARQGPRRRRAAIWSIPERRACGFLWAVVWAVLWAVMRGEHLRRCP